jgi:hypothetical protein
MTRFPLITTIVFLLSAALTQPASARPNPDRAGVCYFFRGEDRELTKTCVISSGYGAGGHYAGLQWPDGVVTKISKVNFCPQQNYDQRGFCKYTVDDREAKAYKRDVFFKTTNADDSDNFDCYRVISTGNSVCYRFNR